MERPLTGTNSMQMLQYQPSPTCWTNAMEAMRQLEVLAQDSSQHKDSNSFLGSAICQAMTFEHQKILSLELTRCHMESLGRPLSSNCKGQEQSDQNSIRFCLSNIDDFALNAYTTFFTYVNQNCVRLTHEVVTARYHESAIILAETTTLALDKMTSILENQALLINAQENAKLFQEESNNQIKKFKEEIKEMIEVSRFTLCVEEKLCYTSLFNDFEDALFPPQIL